MDFVVESLSKWPAPLVTALFCGVGGLLGSLVVAAISRIVPLNKTVATAIVTGFVVLGLQGPDLAMSKVKNSDTARYAVDELKKMRYFAVLFRAHPESEAILLEEFRKSSVGKFNEEKRARLQSFVAELTTKYMVKDLTRAPDSIIFRTIQRNLSVVQQFSKRPEICVAYYKANGQIPQSAQTPKLIEEEMSLKADIIESSIANPSPPREPVSAEEIRSLFTEAYKNTGADIRDLPKLTKSSTVSPDEGCRIAIEFYKALVSLGEQKGARLFRGLLEP
ncbi:hypothetical protein [Prosthecodimorpha staleyi]|uniref:Uncharacterized protein n=1 Tax=Prosthecodimorpha staleyi TaxID=2840188 RepID=A0A947GI55_9HYPH|nr:hypothetical protein [Prosthecodimorpha staleyi]MBT9288844.1 hypothetical protein [Prosthecodimorpha staleyi]